MLSPGDVVLAPDPTYPIHKYAPIIAGADVRSVPIGPGRDFFEDLTAATQQAWPRPKLLFLCYPHNPTTEVTDLAFFEKVVEFAKENNIWVIHDLAYADLVFDGCQGPPASCRPRAPRTWAWNSTPCPRAIPCPAGAWASAWATPSSSTP